MSKRSDGWAWLQARARRLDSGAQGFFSRETQEQGEARRHALAVEEAVHRAVRPIREGTAEVRRGGRNLSIAAVAGVTAWGITGTSPEDLFPGGDPAGGLDVTAYALSLYYAARGAIRIPRGSMTRNRGRKAVAALYDAADFEPPQTPSGSQLLIPPSGVDPAAFRTDVARGVLAAVGDPRRARPRPQASEPPGPGRSSGVRAVPPPDRRPNGGGTGHTGP